MHNASITIHSQYWIKIIDCLLYFTGRRNIHLPTLSWPFRRHTDEGGSMELGASVGFKDNIVMYGGSEDTVRGFENPTYENNAATVGYVASC